MNDPNDQTISLLAIEHGATWPSWGSQVRDRALNLVVEAQLPHESLADLQGRIAHRIAREKSSGMRMVAAGYVCSLTQAKTVDARLEICQTLLQELDIPSPQGNDSGASHSPDRLGTDRRRSNGRRTSGQRTNGQGSESSQPAQLIIGSGGWKDGEHVARATLMELWSRLSGLLPGKVVSLRFDESSAESGAFPIASSPPRGQLASPSRRLRARSAGQSAGGGAQGSGSHHSAPASGGSSAVRKSTLPPMPTGVAAGAGSDR